jgi:hypothetical protein
MKERRDIRLIIGEYDSFLKEKDKILSKYYSDYSNVGMKKYYSHYKKFKDEPFNTKPIKNHFELKSSEDFLNTILKER